MASLPAWWVHARLRREAGSIGNPRVRRVAPSASRYVRLALPADAGLSPATPPATAPDRGLTAAPPGPAR